MSEIRRYTTATDGRLYDDAEGEFISYSAHIAEVQRIHAELREASDVRTNILSGTIDLMRAEFEAKVAALEAENGRMKAPVSDAEWEQFAYDVRIATPTNFVHAKMMEFHQLDNLIAARAQQPSPAQDKEQG